MSINTDSHRLIIITVINYYSVSFISLLGHLQARSTLVAVNQHWDRCWGWRKGLLTCDYDQFSCLYWPVSRAGKLSKVLSFLDVLCMLIGHISLQSGYQAAHVLCKI